LSPVPKDKDLLFNQPKNFLGLFAADTSFWLFFSPIQHQTREKRVFMETDWHAIWYMDGMKTTIDKAGRIVIPAAIRNRAGLRAGTELEMITDDIGIRLVRTGPVPKLVRKGKRLIAKPVESKKTLQEVDLAAMVEEERNRWPW